MKTSSMSTRSATTPEPNLAGSRSSRTRSQTVSHSEASGQRDMTPSATWTGFEDELAREVGAEEGERKGSWRGEARMLALSTKSARVGASIFVELERVWMEREARGDESSDDD